MKRVTSSDEVNNMPMLHQVLTRTPSLCRATSHANSQSLANKFLDCWSVKLCSTSRGESIATYSVPLVILRSVNQVPSCACILKQEQK